MIHLSEEELKKVELLDLLFKYVTADQLRDMVDSQAVVDKLKDEKNTTKPVLTTLYKEHNDLAMRTMSAETKLYALEADFVTLAKAIGRGLNLSADMEYQNLRSRRGIY